MKILKCVKDDFGHVVDVEWLSIAVDNVKNIIGTLHTYSIVCNISKLIVYFTISTVDIDIQFDIFCNQINYN